MFENMHSLLLYEMFSGGTGHNRSSISNVHFSYLSNSHVIDRKMKIIQIKKKLQTTLHQLDFD